MAINPISIPRIDILHPEQLFTSGDKLVTS